MIKVALTGNIGSGKSTVAKIFSVFGIPVFNADNEAQKLYAEDDVKTQLRLFFNNTVFTNDGVVDKKKLAAIIFNDKQALRTVNALIHPLVVKKYDNWCNKYNSLPYTIHEAAIIFEAKLQDNFDYVINVSAPLGLRLQRVIHRDKVSGIAVEERMANQMNDEIKCELSNFVIVNDGKTFLIPQVENIHKELIKIVQITQ